MITNSGNINRIIIKAVIKLLLLLLLLLLFNKLICQNVFKSLNKLNSSKLSISELVGEAEGTHCYRSINTIMLNQFYVYI